MRALAEACASADFHVELPQLAGHGTAMEDMIPTRWADWSGDVEKAYQRLAQRASKIVVMGLSMGGALTLWAGAEHPEVKVSFASTQQHNLNHKKCWTCCKG